MLDLFPGIWTAKEHREVTCVGLVIVSTKSLNTNDRNSVNILEVLNAATLRPFIGKSVPDFVFRSKSLFDAI